MHLLGGASALLTNSVLRRGGNRLPKESQVLCDTRVGLFQSAAGWETSGSGDGGSASMLLLLTGGKVHLKQGEFLVDKR